MAMSASRRPTSRSWSNSSGSTTWAYSGPATWRSSCFPRPGEPPDETSAHLTLPPSTDPYRADHLEPLVRRHLWWPGCRLRHQPAGARARHLELVERQPRPVDAADRRPAVVARTLLLAALRRQPGAGRAPAVRDPPDRERPPDRGRGDSFRRSSPLAASTMSMNSS